MLNNYKLLTCFILNILISMPAIYCSQGQQQQSSTTNSTQATGTPQATTGKTRNVSYYNSVRDPIRLTFYANNTEGSVTIPPKKSITLPAVPDPLDQLVIENVMTGKKDILKNGPVHNPKYNPEINWYANYHIVSDRITPWRNFRLQNVAQRQAGLLMRLPLKILTSLRGPNI